MTVINISDYAKEAASKGEPLCITFFSPMFRAQDGTEANANSTITVENGDVFTVLDAVKEKGGILRTYGEQQILIPWPCACVVIHRPDQAPLENFQRQQL